MLNFLINFGDFMMIFVAASFVAIGIFLCALFLITTIGDVLVCIYNFYKRENIKGSIMIFVLYFVIFGLSCGCLSENHTFSENLCCFAFLFIVSAINNILFEFDLDADRQIHWPCTLFFLYLSSDEEYDFDGSIPLRVQREINRDVDKLWGNESL